MAPSPAPDNSPVRRVLKIAPPPTLAAAAEQQQELKEGQPLETSRVIVLSATKGLLH
jgi:hypothetical protein